MKRPKKKVFYLDSLGINKEKVDVKNFDIKEFRKEFNLNEEEFSDDFLKQKYIECKGNQKLIFYHIIGIDKLK